MKYNTNHTRHKENILMRALLIVLTSLVLLAPLASAGDWWENIKVKGDLR